MHDGITQPMYLYILINYSHFVWGNLLKGSLTVDFFQLSLRQVNEVQGCDNHTLVTAACKHL